MNWLELVKNIAPFILAAVPGVPPVLIPAIVHGIQVAETLPGATGAQKKQSVLDLVVTGLNTTNTITGRTVISATDVAEGVSAGIDATVAAVNAVHSAQTRTANPNPVPPAQS